MSWMAKLYATYEKASEHEPADSGQPLLPIGHTIQNAHINIVVDGQGNFIEASVLPPKSQIILPATEQSAGRTSDEAAYPLADKLQYVAGDYQTFGGCKKSYFGSYEKRLQTWRESNYATDKVKAVYTYICKKAVIRDLISSKVCHVDERDQLLTTWPYEVTEDCPLPELFKVLPKQKQKSEQGDALICWSVRIPGELEERTWEDESIRQSWIDFEAANATGECEGLCMVSGEKAKLAHSHPKKLRHTGDLAKLVSSNDKEGFTYRGRFPSGDHVADISSEVSQKVHNALRWLISRQGERSGDQVVVAWAISGKDIPKPMQSTHSLLSTFATEPDPSINLGQQFALALNKYMKGYHQKFEETPTDSIVIMALDSATPGRMAVTYYRDFMACEYLEMIERWHKEFAWPQRLVNQEKRQAGKTNSAARWVPGAPSPKHIFEVCYGDKSSPTLEKSVKERLLPCIVEGRPLPDDLLRLAVARASNPVSTEYWEWERNLGIACSLYRGYYRRHPKPGKRRIFCMSLDRENQSRDYLFGRLLAVAEKIEQIALYIANVKRPTTAERLMQRFSDRPSETWQTIYKQLNPYMLQLQSSRGGFLENRKKELDEIMSAFDPLEFTSSDPLSPEFLLGFHCQRLALRKKADNDESEEPTEE